MKTNYTESSQKNGAAPMKNYSGWQIRYKLYDVYGSICYEGADYEKAMRKAKLLPSMLVLYAVDENDTAVAVLWAAEGSGLPVVKLDSILPN